MPSCDPALNYAIQMAPQGRGYALFNPQPLRRGNGLVRDPRVEIGDLGYVSDGSFHLLFNVHRRPDDPLQIHGVPAGFRPLERNARLIEYHDRPCPRVMHSNERLATELGAGVSVEGVGGASINWTLERERGATLAYFDKHDVWDAQNKDYYKQYFRSNYKSWVEFVRLLGINRTLKDLVLVTGCDRTRAWATLFSESRTVDARVSLEVQTAVGPGLSLTCSVKWGTSHTFPSLSGPSAAELSSSAQALIGDPEDGDSAGPDLDPSHVTADQCMFIRGWQARSLFRITDLKAAAGYYDPGTHQDTDDADTPMAVEGEVCQNLVEDTIEQSHNTSETLLSLALEAVENNCESRPDDDIILMHDDELELYLPDPAKMEWSSIESVRHYLDRRFRECPPELLPGSAQRPPRRESNAVDGLLDEHSLCSSEEGGLWGSLLSSLSRVDRMVFGLNRWTGPKQAFIIPMKMEIDVMPILAGEKLGPSPLWFVREGGGLGVPVVDKVPPIWNGGQESLKVGLLAEQTAGIKITWPGYQQWKSQSWRGSPDCSFTHLADLVTREVRAFLSEHDSSLGNIGTQSKYVIGTRPGEISAPDVILLGIVSVRGGGRVMPILQLREDFEFASPREGNISNQELPGGP
ncbi:unnamed protein product [Peniophora sp. CBMAI 1063]|nr:unnamed protein product [Peniophora sp. CBMAI 1063]